MTDEQCEGRTIGWFIVVVQEQRQCFDGKLEVSFKETRTPRFGKDTPGATSQANELMIRVAVRYFVSESVADCKSKYRGVFLNRIGVHRRRCGLFLFPIFGQRHFTLERQDN
jgi:hypothetical protein